MQKLSSVIACMFIISAASSMQASQSTGQDNKKKSETVKQLELLNQNLVNVQRSLVVLHTRLEADSIQAARATNKQEILLKTILCVLRDVRSTKISGTTKAYLDKILEAE